MYDELEIILAGTGMEISYFDSSEWWQDGCLENNTFSNQQCRCIYSILVNALGSSGVPLYDSPRWPNEERLYLTEERAITSCGNR